MESVGKVTELILTDGFFSYWFFFQDLIAS